MTVKFIKNITYMIVVKIAVLIMIYWDHQVRLL